MSTMCACARAWECRCVLWSQVGLLNALLMILLFGALHLCIPRLCVSRSKITTTLLLLLFLFLLFPSTRCAAATNLVFTIQIYLVSKLDFFVKQILCW
jgi:hypothetical protein